ncbi:DUF1634 domain-containing protein [Archangium violaceum]|uniref:DUF1634 domain-containing protein n=1 Tax=Archangium violaceum TaxID=83451 RepID=UPI0019504B11|nr:DUF1634 domain-containing protein [Archangium violaceum]QRN98835.1 DUF1634 domain-containing protein [Archangium violaceum]
MSVEPFVSHSPDTSDALARDAGPEVLISNLLRAGVVVSLTLVTFGMSLTFFHHRDYFSSAQALQRLTAPERGPHALAEVLADAMNARGQAFVMVGLLVLMATPVLRVALSLLTFGRQRDRAFVTVTSVVLTLLLLSFLLGGVE